MLKINLKHLILIKIFIIYNLPTIQGNCEIYVSSDSKLIPKFERKIDNFKLEVNITNGKFEISKGESVKGFCETYFGSLKNAFITFDRQHLNKVQIIDLSCTDRGLFYMNDQVFRPIFECLQLHWDIVYNKNIEFSWCKKFNFTSLSLSSKIDDDDMTSFADICYDLEKVSLKSIHYIVQSSQRSNSEMFKQMPTSTDENFNEILDDLKLLKSTKSIIASNKLLQQNLMDLYELNPLLSLANYEMSSIVQGHSYAKYFKEYNDFLNIVWWRNLRLGNWKLFINTLETYAHNNDFDIYSGTSGIAELPANLTEKHSNKLEFEIDMKTVTVPAYIWSYVRPSNNNKDFVIIGYNSPYAEFFSLDHIIFCPDICADIPWLKDIYTSFRYTFAGIMFCCSPEFFNEKNSLDGLPNFMEN